MRAAALPVLLGVLLGGHVLLSVELVSVRSSAIESNELMPPLPVAALKILSLEYDDLVADLLFSRTSSFYGGKSIRRETITPETYQTIYRRLDAASGLDPYFVDPYYFGQAVLTWGANMPREANSLLDRSRRYRTDDWVIPFFMGFNAFYFLGDNVTASQYLMESAHRPGSPPLVGLLAARLAAKGGTTDVVVAFLDQFAEQIEDPAAEQQIRQRADALRGMAILEQAIARYREVFGAPPPDLRALVERGVLPELPADPYGGTYYLTSQGTVWTTSDLRPITK